MKYNGPNILKEEFTDTRLLVKLKNQTHACDFLQAKKMRIKV